MEKEWGKEVRRLQIMNMEMVTKSTRTHLATRGAYQLVLDQMKADCSQNNMVSKYFVCVIHMDDGLNDY